MPNLFSTYHGFRTVMFRIRFFFFILGPNTLSALRLCGP
jgi:hypothetical protein